MSDGKQLNMGTLDGNNFYVLFVRSLNGSTDVYPPYAYLIYIRTQMARFLPIGEAPANGSISISTGELIITYGIDTHYAKGWLFKVA